MADYLLITPTESAPVIKVDEVCYKYVGPINQQPMPVAYTTYDTCDDCKSSSSSSSNSSIGSSDIASSSTPGSSTPSSGSSTPSSGSSSSTSGKCGCVYSTSSTATITYPRNPFGASSIHYGIPYSSQGTWSGPQTGSNDGSGGGVDWTVELACDDEGNPVGFVVSGGFSGGEIGPIYLFPGSNMPPGTFSGGGCNSASIDCTDPVGGWTQGIYSVEIVG